MSPRDFLRTNSEPTVGPTAPGGALSSVASLFQANWRGKAPSKLASPSNVNRRGSGLSAAPSMWATPSNARQEFERRRGSSSSSSLVQESGSRCCGHVRNRQDRRLARASWATRPMSQTGARDRRKNLVGSSASSTTPDPSLPVVKPDEEDGARLVSDIVSSWRTPYTFTIRGLPESDGAFHYECLLGCPSNDAPVPSSVVSTRWALVFTDAPAAQQLTARGGIPTVSTPVEASLAEPMADESVAAVPAAAKPVPRMFFCFEDADLTHEWTLVQDRAGRWQPSTGRQNGSVQDCMFEQLLDTVVRDKTKVRSRGIHLMTQFEASRLPETVSPETGLTCQVDDTSSSSFFSSTPTVNVAPGDGDDSPPGVTVQSPVNLKRQRSESYYITPEELEARETHEAMCSALKAAGLSPAILSPNASLQDLLASMFDSADEDGSGRLSHYEVTQLLGAMLPGLGLESWDIGILMFSAQESEEGFIEYKPFVESSQSKLQELRKRRIAFREKNTTVEIPHESVKFCFSEEVSATVEMLTKAFEACAEEDPRDAVWRRSQPTPKRSSIVAGTPVQTDSSALEAVLTANIRRNSFSSRNLDSVATMSLRRRAQSDTFGRDPWLSRPVSGESSGHCTPSGKSCFHTEVPRSQGDLFRSNTPVGDGFGLGSDDNGKILVGLKRRACRACLASCSGRVSPQEAERLMQMLAEDETGFVFVDNIAEQLESLRAKALLNAIVETDVLLLRAYLANIFRPYVYEGSINFWDLRTALVSADELCLSRLQLHVLFSFAQPANPSEDNAHSGASNAVSFLGYCCVVIPHMFDAKGFVVTAERLQLEHAEAVRRKENAELERLGAATVPGSLTDADDSNKANGQDDRVADENVERTLIQVIASNDDTHRNPPALPAHRIANILLHAAEVPGCGLSDSELMSFLAEMTPDPVTEEVLYVEHVRRWTPTIFELRKNKLYRTYIAEDGLSQLEIPRPDFIAAAQVLFPGAVPESTFEKPERRVSASRRNSRRTSPTESRAHASPRFQDASEKLQGERRCSIAVSQPNSRQSSKGEQSPTGAPVQHHRVLPRVAAKHLHPHTAMARKTKGDVLQDVDASHVNPLGRGQARRQMMLAKA